jgi:CheY-like chemotaxis protein
MTSVLDEFTGRHLAASACVSHGLRNLLAPAQLRMDAWMLQGESAAIAVIDAARIRETLQDVMRMVDGLELLRVAPTEPPPIGATPWPDAVRALLSCIAAGAPCTVDVAATGPADLDRIPRSLVAHVLAEAALVAHDATPHAHADYGIGVSGDTVHLRATFRHVATARSEPLQRALREALRHMIDLPARGVSSLAIDRAHDSLVCCVELPIGGSGNTIGPYPAPPPVDERFSVLCIDDNESLMDALEARLASTDGFSHFIRSRSVADALARLDNIDVSLVLVDVHLGVAHDPFTSISLLRARCPGARIAFFSGNADSEVVERALAHGADGFVYKGTAAQQLIEGIVRLARGEHIVLRDI